MPTAPSLPQAEARANAVAAFATKFGSTIVTLNHSLDMIQRNDRMQVPAHAEGLAALRELVAAFNRIRLFPPFSEAVDPNADTTVIRRKAVVPPVCGYCDAKGHIATACPHRPHGG